MNENTNTLTQEEVNNKEVLEASAEKLAVIASKLAEIFKAGFDAGFIGAKTTALLETYKQEAEKYVNEQLDLIVKGENSDGILNTIKEIGDALNNDANAFNVLSEAVKSAKSDAIAEANKKVPMIFDEKQYTLYGNDKKGKVRLWTIIQTLTSDDYATSILSSLKSSIVARDSTDGYAYTKTPVDDGNPTGKELMRIANVKYVIEKTSAVQSEAKKYTDEKSAQLQQKIDNVAAGTVDDAISSTSENAVQNKVVKAYIDSKTNHKLIEKTGLDRNGKLYIYTDYTDDCRMVIGGITLDSTADSPVYYAFSLPAIPKIGSYSKQLISERDELRLHRDVSSYYLDMYTSGTRIELTNYPNFKLYYNVL